MRRVIFLEQRKRPNESAGGVIGELRKTKTVLGTLLAYRNGYRVTDEGRVIGLKGKARKLKPDHDGYPSFNIKTEGVGYTLRAHNLAAFQWFGRKALEQGVELRHLNGNRTDTSKINLALGTRKQNEQDKPAELRKRCAAFAARSQSRLTLDDVARVREERQSGALLRQLSDRYGVTPSTVSKIANRRTYVDV